MNEFGSLSHTEWTCKSRQRMPETPFEGSREQQLQNFRSAVLQQVDSAVDLVAAKGSPAETDAYRQMLFAVAEKAAEEAKEGGFLGSGGVRVSDKEHSFIAEVKRVVGIGRGEVLMRPTARSAFAPSPASGGQGRSVPSLAGVSAPRGAEVFVSGRGLAKAVPVRVSAEETRWPRRKLRRRSPAAR